ncbi:MAG: glycosyltransferase family 2 protein [Candidatus Binatia bacterium]
MYEGHKIAAVVPAFNESAHIAAVIGAMPAYVDHIIVVDDRSTDGTAAAATAVGDARVQVIQHPVQRGVGGSTVNGMQRALELGADLLVKVDGDGQMDPAHITRLLEPLVRGGYDYAKGNRFLHRDALRKMPLHRLLGNFALTFATKLASGYWHIFDPQNGYLAIKAAAVRALDLPHLAAGFFFENDMLIHLNVMNLRVTDVAIPARYEDEQSSLRVSRILVTFPMYLLCGFLTRVWEKYVLRDFSPIAVFWLVGLALLTWGTLFGGATWVHSLATGHAASTGTVMLSVLPFLMGFELVLQAIILEIRETPR